MKVLSLTILNKGKKVGFCFKKIVWELRRLVESSKKKHYNKCFSKKQWEETKRKLWNIREKESAIAKRRTK